MCIISKVIVARDQLMATECQWRKRLKCVYVCVYESCRDYIFWCLFLQIWVVFTKPLGP